MTEAVFVVVIVIVTSPEVFDTVVVLPDTKEDTLEVEVVSLVASIGVVAPRLELLDCIVVVPEAELVAVEDVPVEVVPVEVVPVEDVPVEDVPVEVVPEVVVPAEVVPKVVVVLVALLPGVLRLMVVVVVSVDVVIVVVVVRSVAVLMAVVVPDVVVLAVVFVVFVAHWASAVKAYCLTAGSFVTGSGYNRILMRARGIKPSVARTSARLNPGAAT